MGVRSRLRDDLLSLRQGDGLTQRKIEQTKALLSLPPFRSMGTPQERSATAVELLRWWLATPGSLEQKAALAIVWGIDPETFEPVEQGDRGSLKNRRRIATQHLSVSIQGVRDREDAAIDRLLVELLEWSMTVLDESHATSEPTGIEQASLDFYRGVDWPAMLASATELDIFFTYGRSWRRSLTGELNAFFERSETSARILLPDIVHPNTTALPEIAKRAGQTVPVLRRNIAEAYEFFMARGAAAWASDAAELYTLYRLDSTMIVTMYNHQRGTSDGVPTFVLRNGALFNWFLDDFERQLDPSTKLSRQLAQADLDLARDILNEKGS